MRQRVYEVAKSLHVDSRTLLDILREQGEFVRSASSQLEDVQVRRARRALAGRAGSPEAQGSSLPVQRSTEPPRTARPHRSRDDMPLAMRWFRGEISDMTRLMLDRIVLPARDFQERSPMPPRNCDVEQASHLGLKWAEQLFTPHEVAEWLDFHRGICASTAGALRDEGLSAEDAARRVWYGRFRAGRPTLAERVACGDLTPEEAAQELRDARSHGQSA